MGSLTSKRQRRVRPIRNQAERGLGNKQASLLTLTSRSRQKSVESAKEQVSRQILRKFKSHPVIKKLLKPRARIREKPKLTKRNKPEIFDRIKVSKLHLSPRKSSQLSVPSVSKK